MWHIITTNKLTNDEIKTRKQDLNKHSKSIKSLSDKLKEYIDVATSKPELDNMQGQYNTVMNLWS